MPSHFEDIGYTFEKPGDLARLYDANAERVEVYDLGTDYYVIDISYSVDTYSDKGVSNSTTDMLLVVFDDEGVIKAEAVSLY